MSLIEQMHGVDLLMRQPNALDALREQLSEEDRAVFATLDRERLAAVNASFVTLVVARWWQPRFPATLATLAHVLGGPLEAARFLVASPAFEGADGEDLTGAAIVGAVIDAQDDALPPWLPDLVGYEYLLSTGLPRRARGEPVDAALEARALDEAAWLSGGRLKRDVLLATFAWPVGALQEEPHDTEPFPETHVLAVMGEEILDAEAPDVAVDALSLLADGADDAVLRAGLGEQADAALAWLRELGLVD